MEPEPFICSAPAPAPIPTLLFLLCEICIFPCMLCNVHNLYSLAGCEKSIQYILLHVEQNLYILLNVVRHICTTLHVVRDLNFPLHVVQNIYITLHVVHSWAHWKKNLAVSGTSG